MIHRKSRRLACTLLVAALATLLPCCRKGKRAPVSDDKRLTMVFYNVENLFDTSDDPSVKDEEFLPGAPKNWNDRRFGEKTGKLSRVLRELGGEELPEIIGLCEVENESVVQALVGHPNLAAGGYRVVHFNDRDSRGIDLALAYRPDEFAVESARLVPVRRSDGKGLPRGILAVTGTAGNGEKFHLFINHWPSRDGNDPDAELGRLASGDALRKLTEGLEGKTSHVVIMGDLNDEPGDESIRTRLGAAPPGGIENRGLVNLMVPDQRRGKGTYRYRGTWQMLDHMIVSRSLTDTTGYRVENGKGEVFSRYWMEFQSRNGEVRPDRTYAGDQYTGGPSDHFPVYFRLIRD